LPIGKVNDRKGKTNADPYTIEYTKRNWLLRFPRGWGEDCMLVLKSASWDIL